MKKLKKSLNALSRLSRDDMRQIVGGYGGGCQSGWYQTCVGDITAWYYCSSSCRCELSHTRPGCYA